MDLISKISKNDLVKVLPKIGIEKDGICEDCQFRKQIKTSSHGFIWTFYIC